MSSSIHLQIYKVYLSYRVIDYKTKSKFCYIIFVYSLVHKITKNNVIIIVFMPLDKFNLSKLTFALKCSLGIGYVWNFFYPHVGTWNTPGRWSRSCLHCACSQKPEKLNPRFCFRYVHFYRPSVSFTVKLAPCWQSCQIKCLFLLLSQTS